MKNEPVIYKYPWQLGSNEGISLSENNIEMMFSGSPVIYLPKGWKGYMPSRMENFVPLSTIKNKDFDGCLSHLPHGKLSNKFRTNHCTLINTTGKHIKMILENISATDPYLTDSNGDVVRSDEFKFIVIPWADIFDDIIDKDSANFDHLLNSFEIGWDEIQNYLDLFDPKYHEQKRSIIIEIAELFSNKLIHLTNCMRRILKRERVLVPLNRVEEIDSSCVKWFSQQSGNTLAEKAGIKQKIMAVSRYESRDTLENKVLKDFVIKCINETNIFVKSDKNKENKYHNVVKKYKSICQSSISDPIFETIGNPPHGLKPNYVLQKDIRYQEIWQYYQKLIRKELAEEIIWDWQSVLWADVSRLLLCTALKFLCYEGTKKPVNGLILKPISNSKAKINKEFQNGLKIMSESLPGPFLITQYKNGKPEKYGVIELIHSNLLFEHYNPIVKQLGIFGAHLIIQITPMNKTVKNSNYLFMWAINGAGSKTTSNIDNILDSAFNSIEDHKLKLRETIGQVPNIRGVVILSNQLNNFIVKSHNQTRNLTLLEVSSVPKFWKIRDYWKTSYLDVACSLEQLIEELL